MASAGDGGARSENRRRTLQIRVRVAPAEQARIARAARREGHGSAAAFLRDLALRRAATRPKAARMIGVLGMAGGFLDEAAAMLLRAGQPQDAAQIQARAMTIVTLQRSLMTEDGDAGESDPHAS